MSRIVFENARLVDARGDHGIGTLTIERGKIVAAVTSGDAANAAGAGADAPADAGERIDLRGRILAPAFIDLHAHLREPGQEVKEDLASGLAAAAAGGYGTVVSMANTDPVVDDPGLVASLIQKAERLAGARLRPAAALSHGLAGTHLTDFAALQLAGAVMITDDGIPVTDAHLMRRACEYAAELDLVIQTHSEEPSLRRDGVMNEGRVSQRLGLPGNPVAAEAAMIYRDCEIAALTGARVHIAHVSSARGMRVVEFFKEQGAPVTCEVTPHHLTLTDETLATFDPVYKVAPPLRTAQDVAYLRDAVARGVVDCIGTDHAPHTRAEKERDLLEAPFGIGNIEVAFPLLYTELVASGAMEAHELIAMLTTGPAAVMGWTAPLLQPGAPADLVVVDPSGERAVDPARFRSKAKLSPWSGRSLTGWPVATWVGGVRVFGSS